MPAAVIAAAAVVALPGCAVDVGGRSDGSRERVRDLERRMDAAERKLGIHTEVAE